MTRAMRESGKKRDASGTEKKAQMWIMKKSNFAVFSCICRREGLLCHSTLMRVVEIKQLHFIRAIDCVHFAAVSN